MPLYPHIGVLHDYGFASDEYSFWIQLDEETKSDVELDFNYEDPDEESIVKQAKEITGLDLEIVEYSNR